MLRKLLGLKRLKTKKSVIVHTVKFSNGKFVIDSDTIMSLRGIVTVLNFLNEAKAICIYKSFCEIELYFTIGISNSLSSQGLF